MLTHACANRNLQTGYLGLQMPIFNVPAGMYVHDVTGSACSFNFTQKNFEEPVQLFYKAKKLSSFSF